VAFKNRHRAWSATFGVETPHFHRRHITHKMWYTTFDAGDPHVQFGGRGHRSQSMLPTPILTCLHGAAFLSWNQHPEPTGSRRATPLLIFQHIHPMSGYHLADFRVAYEGESNTLPKRHESIRPRCLDHERQMQHYQICKAVIMVCPSLALSSLSTLLFENYN
jgi:hypothetical protein